MKFLADDLRHRADVIGPGSYAARIEEAIAETFTVWWAAGQASHGPRAGRRRHGRTAQLGSAVVALTQRTGGSAGGRQSVNTCSAGIGRGQGPYPPALGDERGEPARLMGCHRDG